MQEENTHTPQELELETLMNEYWENYGEDCLDAYEALLQTLHFELFHLREKLKDYPKPNCQLLVENQTLLENRLKILRLLEEYAYPDTTSDHHHVFVKACKIYGEKLKSSDWNYDISKAPKDGTVIAARYDEDHDYNEYIRWETNPHHPAGGHFGSEAWVVLPDLFPSDDPIKWRYVYEPDNIPYR